MIALLRECWETFLDNLHRLAHGQPPSVLYKIASRYWADKIKLSGTYPNQLVRFRQVLEGELNFSQSITGNLYITNGGRDIDPKLRIALLAANFPLATVSWGNIIQFGVAMRITRDYIAVKEAGEIKMIYDCRRRKDGS